MSDAIALRSLRNQTRTLCREYPLKEANGNRLTYPHMGRGWARASIKVCSNAGVGPLESNDCVGEWVGFYLDQGQVSMPCVNRCAGRFCKHPRSLVCLHKNPKSESLSILLRKGFCCPFYFSCVAMNCWRHAVEH